MDKQTYTTAARNYRKAHPSRGFVTPPPVPASTIEKHFNDLWNARFISGTHFDEAYQPASLEYRLYQIYGRSVVPSVLRGDF